MLENEGKKGLEKVNRARPILNALQSFRKVLGMFCPGETSPAAFIWGSFTFILEAS